MHEHVKTEHERAIPHGPCTELPGRPTNDPDWLLVDDDFRLAREHEIESLYTTANGYAGTRGSLPERTSLSAPSTFVAGVFGVFGDQGIVAVPELVKAPGWTHLTIEVNGHVLTMEDKGTLEHRRVLDLRQGVLWRDWRYRNPDGRITTVRLMRLASLADRHMLLQSVVVTPENYSGPVRLQCNVVPLSPVLDLRIVSRPLDSVRGENDLSDMLVFEYGAPGAGVKVALATVSRICANGASGSRQESRTGPDFAEQRWEFDAELGKSCRVDRLVSIFTSRDNSKPTSHACDPLCHRLAGDQVSVDAEVRKIVEDHCRAWKERWEGAEVQVEGDPEAQRALRFVTYHLIATANPDDERVSVGARALTGASYKGHVFWDTEIFMLPFYIFTHPPTARALLMYRYHTLSGAREKARLLGYRGAMYAWESAADGRETTPPWALGPDGALIRILCGEMEQHISADVAYGVWQYWQATGDDSFFLEAGAEILLETARFWASRGSFGPDGLFHINQVIGPDEYHEGVDDNAFTNVLAQWNVARGLDAVRILREQWPRRAGELLDRLKLGPEELDHWWAVWQKMYTGFDAESRLFEQFRGFFDLETIDLAAYEPRTVPIDVLLGRERTQQVQVVKQADVVMLVALLWDDLPPDVRKANFEYYEPRTGHGSSLSPAIHALVAARLGNLPLAEKYFKQATLIDLANNMGNASGGVHAAALGGLWQATTLGFAGMRLRPEGLSFAPRLPERWRRLRFPVCWRGRQLVVSFDQDASCLEVHMAGKERMEVEIEEGPKTIIVPGRCYRVPWRQDGWGTWQEIENS